MKLNSRFFNMGISILCVMIILIAFLRFGLPNKKTIPLTIEEIDEIECTNLNSETIKLVDLLQKSNEVYLLLFEQTNCYSCVYEGIEDIKSIQAAGNEGFAVLINDYFENVKGWSASQNISFVYQLKKSDFYKHIHVAYLPVLIKFKHKQIRNFRYIIP